MTLQTQITKHLAKFDDKVVEINANYGIDEYRKILEQAITEAYQAGAKAVIYEIPEWLDEEPHDLKQELTDKFTH